MKYGHSYIATVLFLKSWFEDLKLVFFTTALLVFWKHMWQERGTKTTCLLANDLPIIIPKPVNRPWMILPS